MLTKPQPYEAEAVIHEAETHETKTKAEAGILASRSGPNSRSSSWGGRGLKNRKK